MRIEKYKTYSLYFPKGSLEEKYYLLKNYLLTYQVAGAKFTFTIFSNEDTAHINVFDEDIGKVEQFLEKLSEITDCTLEEIDETEILNSVDINLKLKLPTDVKKTKEFMELVGEEIISKTQHSIDISYIEKDVLRIHFFNIRRREVVETFEEIIIEKSKNFKELFSTNDKGDLVKECTFWAKYE